MTQAWRRTLVAAACVLLVLGTINVFLVFDAGSHSASDTLRPFLLTMLPVWLVAIWAARGVLRAR